MIIKVPISKVEKGNNKERVIHCLKINKGKAMNVMTILREEFKINEEKINKLYFAISQVLRKLTNDGLVGKRRHGRNIVYWWK